MVVGTHDIVAAFSASEIRAAIRELGHKPNGATSVYDLASVLSRRSYSIQKIRNAIRRDQAGSQVAIRQPSGGISKRQPKLVSYQDGTRTVVEQTASGGYMASHRIAEPNGWVEVRKHVYKSRIPQTDFSSEYVKFQDRAQALNESVRNPAKDGMAAFVAAMHLMNRPSRGRKICILD